MHFLLARIGKVSLLCAEFYRDKRQLHAIILHFLIKRGGCARIVLSLDSLWFDEFFIIQKLIFQPSVDGARIVVICRNGRRI